ncbi:MAG TPA: hypothetical protein VEA80_03665 [Vitreimonas sp.]|uniref:hypothetical protein n=1 Tax=Vitreimonas sp. TaxID=3069702 RepID=UPI002D22B161|nr:hypothetical protein [Vitreimonas sp.]HYD86547.1 hypothetical protein [Vitreimonas sp.]
MVTNPPPPSAPDAAALLAAARAGGAHAAVAARRAAWLAERDDPALAREALTVAIRLEPMDPAPRLALARLAAEQGDLGTARAEARGVMDEAVDQAARARAAFIVAEIARVEGDLVAARECYTAVLRIEDEILRANRADATAARWYARARGRLAELDASEGQRERARVGAEGALAMLRATAAAIGEPPVLAADIADAELRLGALELDERQAASARRRFAEAIGRYEALAVTEPDEPHWRAVLSDAWALAAEADYARGAHDRAREAMDKALQARLRLAAKNPREAWALAGTWRIRGALRAALGDHQAAAESLCQARLLAEQLAAPPCPEAAARFFIHTLLDQADHALRTGETNLAREAADTARMHAETVARIPLSAPIWLTDIAAAWDRLGEVARGLRALNQAQGAFARAVEFRRMALDREPDNARSARGLAAALVKHGEAALEAGALAGARAAFQESATMRLTMYDAAPEDPRAAQALAVALERLGLVALAQGDKATACAAWEDELILADRIFSDEHDIEALRFRAIVETHLFGVADPLSAEAHRKSALARFDELAKAGAMTEREAELRKRLWRG